MRIQHNIMAMNAYRNYNINTSALSKNLEKLSSGYKINRAGDDAAGLAISEKMRAQITGLNAAQKNVKDGISLVKTAEGAMQEIQDMLNRMDYLATQSANGTYDNEVDRANLQKEVDALKTEINRIADSANFNGIKLLDGSMDEGKVTTRQAASAISDIKTNAYAPQGMSDAFKATFITNRPEGNANSVKAEFSVSLDDLSINAISNNAGDKVTVELKIGDFTLSTSMDGNAAYTAGQIVTALVAKGGFALDTGDTTNSTLDTANRGAYIKLGDAVYKMTADTQTNTIKFTQDEKNLKALPNGHDNINPNYAVSVTVKGKQNGVGNATDDITNNKTFVNGTLDWQVQDTVTGKVPGSTRQAQVSLAIDFSKLKDGDKLTAGNKTYVFSIGKDSIYADNTKYTPKTGETVIDLRDIFKEESDLANDNRQLDAMDTIVNAMKTSGSHLASQKAETWEAGNGGVDSGIGTITFQSLSNYTGETTNVTTDDAYIGGDQANGICDMRTEASVMKQFFASSAETSASVSFSLDASKIKVGDTVSIGGKTFEFTDGPTASSKNNVAVDLSTMGVSGGLVASQTGQVLESLKTAINNAMPEKYTVDVDSKSNTMTVKSKDIAGTTTFENRVAAAVKLPTVSSTGKALNLQIGDTSDSFNQMKLSIGDMHVNAMGTKGGATIADITIANQTDAQAAVQTIKDAINYVSGIRGDLGATQNRLEHTSNNLSVMAENIQDAESTIRDTDVAEEMMKYTKNNILIQSAQAMLAQANAVPQGVLQLLG